MSKQRRVSRRGFALAASGDGIVDAALAPLAQFFGREGIEDIIAVRPGEVRLEVGGRWVVAKDDTFTIDFWKDVARVLAGWKGLAWDEDDPQVSVQLPGGHRFELLAGQSVRSGISVAIRVKRRGLYDYDAFAVPPPARALLEQAAGEGWNVIISGGTASGKTSFINRFIRDIPGGERVLIAEDTEEIDECVENLAGFVVGRHGGRIDYGVVFDHAMRARPDRLFLGELSIKNAFPALLFLNNGHKGLLSTMHANSCRDALETGFWLRCSLAGHKVEKAVVGEFLRGTVDLVVQVSRHAGRRQLVETWRPAAGEEPVRYVGGQALC